MALGEQILDHSGWYSNPLCFNVFAPVAVGVREGEKRKLRQVRSNLLPRPNRMLAGGGCWECWRVEGEEGLRFEAGS
jgi:hypothetical protein